MSTTYSEKLATQLVGRHDGTLSALRRHCWFEAERMAAGVSAENEWGVDLYSAICDRQVQREQEAA